jgi:flagellin
MAISGLYNGGDAQRLLSLSMWSAARDLARIASGDRIFTAAEDPAGLIISERLRSQIGSLRSEISNISMTIDKYSSVSSTVTELHDQLIEIRSLAVAAANEGVNSPDAQAAYARAASDIVAGYNKTIESAEYNGHKTLDGSSGSLAQLTPLSGIDLSTAEGATASMALVDATMQQVQQAQIDLGSKQRYDLESRRAQLEVTQENLIASESNIRDTDFATAYSDYIGNMIRARVGAAMSAHQAISGAIVLQLLGQ